MIETSIHVHGRTETLYLSRPVPGNNLDLFMSTRTRSGKGQKGWMSTWDRKDSSDRDESDDDERGR